MRKIFLLLFAIPLFVFGQTRPRTYSLYADTSAFRTIDNSGNEIVIWNATKDTAGVFINIGNGVTKFISYAALKNILGVTGASGTVTSITLAKNAGGDSIVITVANAGVTTRTAVLDRTNTGDVTQESSGTQVTGQIPFYTATAKQISKGASSFVVDDAVNGYFTFGADGGIINDANSIRAEYTDADDTEHSIQINKGDKYLQIRSRVDATHYATVYMEKDETFIGIKDGATDVSMGFTPTGMKALGINSYANDAAADADSNLCTGCFYRVTGERTIKVKP